MHAQDRQFRSDLYAGGQAVPSNQDYTIREVAIKTEEVDIKIYENQYACLSSYGTFNMNQGHSDNGILRDIANSEVAHGLSQNGENILNIICKNSLLAFLFIAWPKRPCDIIIDRV